MSTLQTTTVSTDQVCTWGHGTERQLAFQFTAPVSGTIGSAQVYAGTKVGSPTGNTRVSIFSNSSGVPGSVIGSWSAGVATPAHQQYTFTISPATTIVNSTLYWFVLDIDNGVYDSANFYEGSGDNTSAHGYQVYSFHNGTTWQVDYPTTSINTILTITATSGGDFLVFM
jgi:hypothetical protein